MRVIDFQCDSREVESEYEIESDSVVDDEIAYGGTSIEISPGRWLNLWISEWGGFSITDKPRSHEEFTDDL